MPEMPEMPMDEPTQEERVWDEAMRMRLLFQIPKNQPVLIWDVKEGNEEVYQLLIKEVKDGES